MGAKRPTILVVGAGPTGLTAALELWRLGYAPRIIDREKAPTPLSKAVGVSPHSLDLLEPCGVTGRLLARGIRMRRVQARYGTELLATIDLSRLPHRFNFLLSLPQSETERLMEDALAEYGGQVEWRTELKRIRVTAGGVEVDLKAARRIQTARFDYLFAADGVNSRVRESLGMGFSGYTRRRLWSIADAEIPDWPYPDETAEAILHPNGDIGFIIPIGERRFRAVSNTSDALAQIPGIEFARVLRMDTFHLPIRQADSYQRGAVFLGGDAAHVHSPLGARGMNLGIEDAVTFARRLAEGTLDGYTAERHPVGQRWMKLSERLLSGAQVHSEPAVTARNLAARAVGVLPMVQKPMLERVAGLRE